MKVTVIYDGACPFCNEYVRHQRLRAAVDELELVDARANPEVLRAHAIDGKMLEDGMVVIADGRQHHGGDAVHLLAMLSESPRRWWVHAVAFASRSSPVARLLYPVLRSGRRIALTLLGIPRFPKN